MPSVAATALMLGAGQGDTMAGLLKTDYDFEDEFTVAPTPGLAAMSIELLTDTIERLKD